MNRPGNTFGGGGLRQGGETAIQLILIDAIFNHFGIDKPKTDSPEEKQETKVVELEPPTQMRRRAASFIGIEASL